MTVKEISVDIDPKAFSEQIDERRREFPPENKALAHRTTVFSAGKDRQIVTVQQIAAPNIEFIEILKDGLKNNYAQINWRTTRWEVDAGGAVGFNIYRRTVTDQEPLKEVPRDIAQRESVTTFSRDGVDRLSQGITRQGRFAPERKSYAYIDTSKIPTTVINPRLQDIQQVNQAQFLSNLNSDQARNFLAEFERFLNLRRFRQIGFVDYSKFINAEKQKFVSVREREFVDMSFRDKNVRIGERYEYYVTALSVDGRENPRSTIVKVDMRDQTPIDPPISLIVKQRNESEIQLSVATNPGDKIEKVLFFRKTDDDEVAFRRVATAKNIRDCVQLLDKTVEYTKTYTYRVILENIHGVFSQPSEVTYVSTVQKITPQSRSNNLRIPIMNAVQDQNSDFIKVTISPNDNRIAFYELTRRDLTIHERRFSNVSQTETNYGGTGWITNKFEVPRVREIINDVTSDQTGRTISKNFLKRKARSKEIVFIDDTISPNHIYQYRVQGSDLFGNKSSFAFDLVRAEGKKAVRTPVNLKSETLRGFPFRAKIVWSDDNLATEFSASQLFDGISSIDKDASKTIYRVQRRKLGENQYESFPLTANTFLIDEVASLDPVDFQAIKVEDTFEKEPNQISESPDINLQRQKQQRPFGIPDFLTENSIYFYRVEAIADNGDRSNFTEEFEVSSLPDLSDPINLKVEVVNSRVRPLIGKVSWGVDLLKFRPDHWLVQRKFDTTADTFETLGRSYLETNFFDKTLELGSKYIYRIKSVDAIGRESDFFEVRLDTT